jgi:hypothetical protein
MRSCIKNAAASFSIAAFCGRNAATCSKNAANCGHIATNWVHSLSFRTGNASGSLSIVANFGGNAAKSVGNATLCGFSGPPALNHSANFAQSWDLIDTLGLEGGEQAVFDGADALFRGQFLVPEAEIFLFGLVLGDDPGDPDPPVPILGLSSPLHGQIVAPALPGVD